MGHSFLSNVQPIKSRIGSVFQPLLPRSLTSTVGVSYIMLPRLAVELALRHRMASEKSFTAFLDVFFVSGGGGGKGEYVRNMEVFFFPRNKGQVKSDVFLFVFFLFSVCLLVCYC